jgi:hypothetical protein
VAGREAGLDDGERPLGIGGLSQVRDRAGDDISWRDEFVAFRDEMSSPGKLSTWISGASFTGWGGAWSTSSEFSTWVTGISPR